MFKEKYCIIGLGNPAFYDGTRHNVGAEYVENLCKNHYNEKMMFRKDLEATWGCKINKDSVLHFIKSNCFINDSGNLVDSWERAMGSDYKIVIVVDDIDLPHGKIRYQEGGSDETHRGLKDIINVVGPDFARLKIGIGKPRPKSGVNIRSHVLGAFTIRETRVVEKIFDEAKNTLECILFGDNCELSTILKRTI